MNRQKATELIIDAKIEKGITWEALAGAVGRHKCWTTAALLGQHPMTKEEADAAVSTLGLTDEVSLALQRFPMRGSLGNAVPVDPTIYRFYELIQVYGTTFKELIHETFGDGIMSAIDFEMEMKREENPKGDRVVITLNGKYLPYRKF